MSISTLHLYTARHVQEINDEYQTRIDLCRRAHGIPVTTIKTVMTADGPLTLTQVRCLGGICEHCHNPANALDPHHLKHKSQGGKFTEDNILMVHNHCHKILQKSSPMWTGRGSNAK